MLIVNLAGCTSRQYTALEEGLVCAPGLSTASVTAMSSRVISICETLGRGPLTTIEHCTASSVTLLGICNLMLAAVVVADNGLRMEVESHRDSCH